MNKKKNLTKKEIFDLAVQNQKKNNLNIAQDLYIEVLEIDPNYVNAHYNLGVVFK